MTRVYKYPFQITDVQKFDLPRGARIRLVEKQSGLPCIWAEVNPDAPMVSYNLRVYGTGHDIDRPYTMEHVGSFQDGPYVRHVYLEPMA